MSAEDRDLLSWSHPLYKESTPGDGMLGNGAEEVLALGVLHRAGNFTCVAADATV
jgi:hypothetical protein